MFYKALYFFGFMPKLLQIIILITIGITVTMFFCNIRKSATSIFLFMPSILLTFSHICERIVRWFGNNTKGGMDFFLGMILLIFLGYVLGRITNYNNMFIISTLFVIVCCITQNIFFIALIPIALLLLVITAIKSIISKNFKELLMCIVVGFLALIMPPLGWSFNFAVTAGLVFVAVSLLNLSLVRTVAYTVLAMVLTLLFTPWVAIESVLIIEEGIRCIKYGKVLSFFIAMLANFFAFWVIGVIFNHEIVALAFIILTIIILKVLL